LKQSRKRQSEDEIDSQSQISENATDVSQTEESIIERSTRKKQRVERFEFGPAAEFMKRGNDFIRASLGEMLKNGEKISAARTMAKHFKKKQLIALIEKLGLMKRKSYKNTEAAALALLCPPSDN